MTGFFGNLLAKSTPFFPYIIIGILIFAIGLMVYVITSTYRAIKKGEKERVKKEPKQPIPPEERMPPIGGVLSERLTLKGYFRVSDMSLSFLRALRFLRRSLDTFNYKYRLPWYLLLGATDSGKTSLLKGSEIRLPIGMPDLGLKDPDPPCRWWFFNRGIVLDIKGRYLTPDRGTKADEQGWRSLLTLLARYRSSRPIDGIILTIPVTELYGRNKLSRDEVGDRAKYIAQKLITAQKGLGLRLPVYVVLTKCDTIPGFQNICQELPNRNRLNMLGWSSPYAVHMPYTPEWLDEAFGEINASLNKLRLEIFSQGQINDLADGIFVFPGEISGIRHNLSVYLDQVFKQSTFDESLVLRGIYFAGDSGVDLPPKTFLEMEEDPKDSDVPAGDDNFKKPKLTVVGGTEAKVPEVDEKGLPKAPPPLKATPQELAEELAKQPTKAEDVPKTEDAPTGRRRHIYFIHDLITEKIFKESNLAHPMHSRLITANRSLNIAKACLAAFVVIGSFGVFNAYNTLDKNRDYLLPVLNRMDMALQDIKAEHTGKSHASVHLFDNYSKQLLVMMNQMHEASFFSLFVPPSWFSPLRGNLQDSLKISYEQIIIRTLYMDLMLRARDLLSTRPLPERKSRKIGQVLLPTSTYEYALFKNYVEQWALLLQKIKRYNRLKDATNADLLKDLVAYSFQIQLPDAFVDQYQNFRSVFKEIPYPTIDTKLFEKTSQKTLDLLYRHFVATILSPNKSNSILGQLHKLLDQFGHSRFRETPSVSELRDYSRSLATAVPALGKAGKTWLDKAYFDPGNGFSDVLGMIGESPLFGNNLIHKMASHTAKAFVIFKEHLKATNDMLIEKPLMPAEVRTMPAQGIIHLSKSLRDLFGQPFMYQVKGRKFLKKSPKGKLIIWDSKLIQIAVDLASEYDKFLAKKLGAFPPALQTVVRQIALANLQGLLVTYIARSQTFIDIPKMTSTGTSAIEKSLLTKIGDVNTVAPMFTSLLEIIEKDKLGTTFIDLRDLLAKQTSSLLKQVDKILVENPPYRIRSGNFDWWQGLTPPVMKGFNANDLKDIEAYVERQRKRMKQYAQEYAQPLVTFLNADIMKNARFDRAMVNKWRRVIEQMEKYDAQQPDNSLSELENFITQVLPEISLSTCFQTIPIKSTRQKSSDIFAQKISNLKKKLLGRCEVLKRRQSIKNYGQLVKFFDENLNGRFPFISPNARASSGDADPQAIYNFYKMYDNFGGSPEAVLDQLHQLGPIAQKQLEFLKSIATVREFFDAYLGGDPARDVPTFDFEVQFRVNRNNELGGNKIIEWYFKPDDSQKIESYDNKKSGQWVIDSPVEFGFRWSTSANIAPGENPQQQAMAVSGRTASFNYTGRWALLWLIRNHSVAPNDVGAIADPNPYTLRFDVPTGADSTRVFNRLIIKQPPTGSAPGKVLIIPTFPTLAPKIDQPIMDSANKSVIVDGRINQLLERYNLAPVVQQDVEPSFGTGEAGGEETSVEDDGGLENNVSDDEDDGGEA